MVEYEKILSVCMITYNHQNYIQQAIDSILLQKTNFDYELIIVNDCSTDKTNEIISDNLLIEEKRKIIKYICNDKNIGPSRNIVKAIQNCHGRYVAFCEGDDFWPDPYKLQKQVDFLEMNSDFGMVYTGANIVDHSGRLIYTSNENKPSGNIFHDLLKSAFIINCTVCIRNMILEPLNTRAIREDLWFVMDYWYWVYCSMEAKIYYLNEATSAYRSHEHNITKTKTYFFQERIPLILLDIIKTRLETREPIDIGLAFLLSRDYISALFAGHVTFQEKKKYLFLLRKHPWLLFGVLPALVNKLVNRINSLTRR
jgi:glycosyltransferase involved in cell wall biosynthesis